jgi:Flp pilus assembly protein TadD
VRDKKAALRFVSRIVERQPSVSQAQYALAQAALAAGENDQALSAVRRARALRPDWEQAVLLECQESTVRARVREAKSVIGRVLSQ